VRISLSPAKPVTFSADSRLIYASAPALDATARPMRASSRRLPLLQLALLVLLELLPCLRLRSHRVAARLLLLPRDRCRRSRPLSACSSPGRRVSLLPLPDLQPRSPEEVSQLARRVCALLSRGFAFTPMLGAVRAVRSQAKKFIFAATAV